MNKNDYLVVDTVSGTVLAKVISVRNDSIHVLLEDGCHLPTTKQTMDIEAHDVVLNLGPNPRKGHVFGVDTTDLFVKTKTHDIVGDVHFFYKPSRESFESLWKAYNIVHNRLKKHGMERLLQDDLTWEVYSEEGGGKYAGMYVKSKHEDVAPVIRIRPEKMAAPQFPYVIAHELGHHLHFTYLQDSLPLNGAWIKLYNKSISVTPVTEQVCKNIKRMFHDSAVTVAEFKRTLDEEDRRAFAKILSHIKSHHQIDTKAIDVLLSSNNWASVEEMWPRQVSVKDLKPMVSEYGLKDWTELLAEAFAFYITGMSMPAPVTKLVERTLSYAKTQF